MPRTGWPNEPCERAAVQGGHGELAPMKPNPANRPMAKRSDIELSAEERLRLSEKRMRLAQAVAHVGSWEIDLFTHEMWGSDEAFKLYGVELTSGNRLPLEIVQSIPTPESRATLDVALRRLLANEAPYDVEFEVVRRDDGARRVIHSLAEVVRDDQGRPIAVNGTLQDVTERKAMEVALRASEERSRMLVEEAADAIVLLGPDRRITSANRRAVELWGCTLDELVPSTLPPLFVEGEFERQPAQFDLLDRGEITVSERKIVRRDRTPVSVELRSRKLPDGTYQIILRDLTERQRAEEDRARLEAQLHRAQKMEAIGLLAGGIAHDFNNLLTVIGGSASLGLADATLSASTRESFAEISTAVASAANLTRQLLAFSRKQVIAPRVLDLNEVIRHVTGILRRVLGEGIAVHSIPARDLGAVRIDPGQVEQLLVNLAINSRDAMKGQGTLTIETSNVRLDESYARQHPLVTPGDYVLLVVSDDGAGMSAETKSHLFEPFFTTKAPGHGTGLGLAMVYGAVKQNAGHVEVYSEVGRGTSFKIYLPRVDSATEELGIPAATAVARGTELIAVVEDDVSVRTAAASMLRWLGYRVHACANGAEALAQVPALLMPPALLITDVIMPGMNGRELATQLRERLPGLKVLYASGYTHNVIAHQGVLDEGIEFLSKPYSLETLGRRVREVLDGAGKAGP